MRPGLGYGGETNTLDILDRGSQEVYSPVMRQDSGRVSVQAFLRVLRAELLQVQTVRVLSVIPVMAMTAIATRVFTPHFFRIRLFRICLVIENIFELLTPKKEGP